MSSTFTTFSGQKVKGFAGKEYSVPVYLQFVPGYCAEVIHSQQSLGFKGEQTINSIYAVSHVSTNLGKKRQQSFSEDNRYFPLLRNHGDVPTKGDPVLLCTIGKINYYLGPLNTINNSPTWNDDLNYRKELTIQSKDIQKNTQRGQRGESLNFNKEALFKRLQKLRNEDLDYGKVVNEVTGDYLIEGRHGNSVRVGSRSNNPYIFISNKRGDSNVLESLSDGSLITITSNGTLAQHFPSYYDVNNEESVFGFTLSSDGNENNNYPIGTIHSDLNNGADIQDTIYGYDTNQILFNSDRITLNSKLDDIFVSSIKDIYIGSGRHLSINASTSLNVLSDNVNIGNPNKSTMESMVLGEKLQKALNAIVDLIPSIQILTQLGNQSPLPVIQKDISNVKGLIDDIISTKHKIEQG
jgi:hypothetical protein